MTLEIIVEHLKDNMYNYSGPAQENDIKLICKFLRYKYNNDELRSITHSLIAEIERRNGNPILWLSDH